MVLEVHKQIFAVLLENRVFGTFCKNLVPYFDKRIQNYNFANVNKRKFLTFQKKKSRTRNPCSKIEMSQDIERFFTK